MFHFKPLFWILLACSFQVMGQEKVQLNYSELVHREDFSEENEDWPFIASYENLFGIDKDEYFLHRMNRDLPYALMAKWKTKLTSFNILTAIKLGPADDRSQSMGVIFYVQPDGQGAIVFEMNKFKEYRVKQLVGKFYRYLTGAKENLGWVKSSLVRVKNEYNSVDIKVEEGQIDFYLNDKFIESFDALEYGPGSMGLIIGPNTKAKVDYFYLYTTPEAMLVAKGMMEELKVEQSAREKLRSSTYEVEQLRRENETCIAELERVSENHEKEKSRMKRAVDGLQIQINALQDFKDRLLVEVDEDVYLTLTGELKDEIMKNQVLMKEVKQFRDSLWMAHTKYSKLKVALLDKAVVKGKKVKAARDKEEASNTKRAIEKELKEDGWKTEQEDWESEKIKNTRARTPATASGATTVVGDMKEALPVPIPVKKAVKKKR
jgi:hypothetical protein